MHCGEVEMSYGCKGDCGNDCDGRCGLTWEQRAPEYLKDSAREIAERHGKTRLGFPRRDRSELSRLIEKALARGPMTPEEKLEQCVSFVYGQMMDCAPHITKEQVRKTLRKHYCML